MPGEDFLSRITLELRHRQQQVFSGNVLVLEIVGFLEGALQQLVHGLGESGLGSSARDFGQALDLAIGFIQDCLGPHSNFFQNGQHDAFAIFEQRGKQVDRHEFRIAVLRRQVIGALHRFLRFNSEFVPTDCHGFSPRKNLLDVNSQHFAFGN